MRESILCANAANNARVALIDAGSPPGYLYIRTGAAPAETTDADTGTLLSTHALSNPSFGAAAATVSTANPIANATCAATATAGHWRIKNAAGVTILQGTVGLTGSDINFDDVDFEAGATVSITSFTLTQPQA